MKVDLSQEDLINMVNGVSPSSIQECLDLQKEGLMVFTGNQHNESWGWVQSKLKAMSMEKLFEIYAKHK